MIFIEDVLKIVWYILLVLTLCASLYLAYELYPQEINGFIQEYIIKNQHLQKILDYIKSKDRLMFLYSTIRDMTWMDWAKIAIIVFSPIVATFVVIMGQDGFHFRKKRKTVDYHRNIKGWWR